MCADQEQIGGDNHGQGVDEAISHEAAHMPQPTGKLGRGLEQAHRAEQDEEGRRMLHAPHSTAQDTQHPGSHNAATQNQQRVSKELILGNIIVDRKTIKSLNHAQGEQRQHNLDRTVEQLSRPVLTSRQGTRVQGHEDQGHRLDRQTPQSKDQSIAQQERNTALMTHRHQTAPSTPGGVTRILSAATVQITGTGSTRTRRMDRFHHGTPFSKTVR
mgnify:CR=1 FL=1